MENDKEKTVYPGFVKGYVSDANTEARIADAVVTAVGTNGSYTTGNDGAYWLQLLAGTYTIRVTANGYKSAEASVRINAFETTTKNFNLTKV